jgi:O-antigen/teichoic acid export membrane protein
MIVRSALSNWASLLVHALISFILTPILIGGLGNLHYAMYVLCASMVEYSGLLDLGLRNSLPRFFARYRGSGDRRLLDETFSTAFFAGVGVSGLIVLASFAAARWLPLFFRLYNSEAAIFSKLLLLLGLSVAVNFPARTISAYLCGLQRYDLVSLGSILTAISRAILLVVILRLGFGVIAAGAVTLFVSVITLLLFVKFVRRQDPDLRLNWNLANWTRLQELGGFTIYVFLVEMGNLLRFQIDSAVISRVLQVALVTPFSVANRLVSYLRAASSSSVQPLTTFFAEMEGAGRQEDERQLFLRSTRLTGVLSLCLSALLFLNGKTVIRLWVGSRFLESYQIMLVLMAGQVVSMLTGPSVQLFYAHARHKWLAIFTLAEGAANLGLSVYWAHSYGLLGVAMGTAVPQIFMKLVFQPWYTMKVIRISFTEFASAVARPLAATAIFFVIPIFLPCIHHAHTWGGLVVQISLQTTLFASIAFWVGIAEQDRNYIAVRAKRVLGALRKNALIELR